MSDLQYSIGLKDSGINEALNKVKESINNVDNVAKQANKSFEQVGQTIKQSVNTGVQAAVQDVSKLKAEISEINKEKMTFVRAGEAVPPEVNAKLRELRAELKEVEVENKRIEESHPFNGIKESAAVASEVVDKQLSKSAMTTSQAFSTLGEGIKNTSNHISNMTQKALMPMGLELGVALNKTADYEAGVSKLGTISGLSIEKNRDLSKSIEEIGASNNISAVDGLEAAYQGFSSSLFKSKEDVENLMPQMDKLSKVGFTDLTSVTDLTSSAINAFHLETGRATNLMDEFLQVQNKGKTTVGELAQAFGQVAPTANALGVSVEEVNASFISLTKQGLSTDEAGTQMKALFTSLAKPTGDFKDAIDKTGISLRDFEKGGGTVAGYLQKIGEATGKTSDQIFDLIPNVRASAGQATLASGNFKEFNQALKDVGNSGGSVDKTFATWSKTMGGQIDSMKSKFEQFTLKLGNAVLPHLQKMITYLSNLKPKEIDELVQKFINLGKILVKIWAVSKVVNYGVKTVENFNKISEAVSASATLMKAFGSASISGISKTISFVGKGITAIREFGLATKIATGFQAAFNLVMSLNPIILIITAITAAVALFAVAWAKDWGGIREKFKAAWDGIKAVLEPIIAFFKFVFGAVIAIVYTVFIKPFLEVMKGVIKFIKDNWGPISAFFSKLWEAIKMTVMMNINIIIGIIKVLITVFKGLYEAVKWVFDRIGDVFNWCKGIVNGFVSWLGNIFKPIGDMLFKPFKIAVQWIKDVFNNLVNWFKNIPGRIMSAFTGLGSSISKTIGGALKSIPGVGGMLADTLGFKASGGRFAGQANIWGEKGPEALINNGDGEILNTNQIEQVVRDAISRAKPEGGNNNNNSNQPQVINLNVDGQTIFSKIFKDSVNNYGLN